MTRAKPRTTKPDTVPCDDPIRHTPLPLTTMAVQQPVSLFRRQQCSHK